MCKAVSTRHPEALLVRSFNLSCPRTPKTTSEYDWLGVGGPEYGSE